jgi:hypothetical protein
MSFPSFVLICLILFIPTVWSIVNIATRDFSSTRKKVLWGAFVVFMPPVGGVVYFISYQIMQMTKRGTD